MLMILLGGGIVFALSRNMELNENILPLVLIVGASLWCVQNRASNDKMAESCFLVSIYFLSVMLSRVINNNVEQFNIVCDTLIAARDSFQKQLSSDNEQIRAMAQLNLDNINKQIGEAGCEESKMEPWLIAVISGGGAIFLLLVVILSYRGLKKKVSE